MVTRHKVLRECSLRLLVAPEEGDDVPEIVREQLDGVHLIDRVVVVASVCQYREITRHPPKQWNSIWLGSTPVRMSVSGDNLIVLCENGALWRIIQRNHGRLTKHRQAWTVQIARALYHGVKE